MRQRMLWLKWSWRDLRQRAVLVTAIALVIALGTGTYAALLGTSAWRTQSNDASFAILHTHDLRVRLTQGSTTTEGALLRAVHGIPHAADVAAARERLVQPIQVAGPNNLLVSGELVGTATGPGPGVDEVSRSSGRALTAGDDATPAVVVERAFAAKNKLPVSGELTISGGTAVHYVGAGQSPEYFLVQGGEGALPFLSQKSYAVLFATLHTAQRLIGKAGEVNDIVLTLRPGADQAAVHRELNVALGASVGATVTDRSELASYRVLYKDIDGDAKLWRIIALLLLGGAALAALNLTSRIVEAQRREIGIGMALGVERRRLAVRPLMFGVQVALIGVVLGVVVGVLVGLALRSVFVGMVPLPIWRTPFQLGMFAQAAALGFGLPFLAVLWPVWRAVRVEPVDAIRVGHLTARGGRIRPVLGRLAPPGRSWRHIPLRNLSRTPRRSTLTAIAVAASVAILVTIFGFLDTFQGTLSRSQDELLRSAPQRVTVAFAGFEPRSGPVVSAVRSLPHVASASPGLVLGTTARTPGHKVDLLTEVLPSDPVWTPTITHGTPTGGVVLAEKAARDLHVGVGDSIELEHPQASPDGTLHTVTTSVRVAGLHPNPMRVYAYLDPASAGTLNLAAVANEITVMPTPGTDTSAVRRELLAVPGVASAESVRATTDGMRDSLQEYLGILRVGAGVTLLLALLIAFNTASIGADERARENATMRAFGLPVRSVLGLTVTETAILGALGTLLGLIGGFGLLALLTRTTIPSVLPEIGVTAVLSTNTIVTALVLGVGTVAAAPLLTLRRLRRLDIPAKLRVVE